MRCLLIEDEPDTSRYICTGLQESGYSVLPCGTMFLSTSRPWCVSAILVAILGGLSYWAPAISAEQLGPPAARSLETIVVTPKRLPEALPDEVVKTRVETALHDDPYFFDGHVTVTVKNGVVHLQGIVFDAADMQDVRRIVRKNVSGVRRVVNELEICSCDGGGGA
jgi:hypothetical protein